MDWLKDKGMLYKYYIDFTLQRCFKIVTKFHQIQSAFLFSSDNSEGDWVRSNEADRWFSNDT